MANPRTSLNLPAALVKQAKRIAVDDGRTLSAIVAEALQKYLDKRTRDDK